MGETGATSEALLDVQGLTKHFGVRRLGRSGGVVKAVDGVSFQLRRGETLGLVGESGCGKSTLAKLLMLLEEPTSGRSVFEGRDMHALRGNRRKALRRDVQMIMQDPYGSLNPRMTVEQIIGEPFEIHPDVAPRGSRRARVKELMDVVGLNPEHAGRRPGQFSGGQRQRIGIARALALRPKVIICDEPVSALDVSIQAQVMNLLAKLQSEFELSYVFIAHDLSVVRHLSDRVAVMYLGKIVEIGDVEDIYSRPQHPYTRALLSAVPTPDPGKKDSDDVIPLDGDLPSPLDPPPGCPFHTRCFVKTELSARGVDTSACTGDVPRLETVDGRQQAACHFPRSKTQNLELAER